MLLHYLTHWGRVTHICVSKLTIIGSDNGLSPSRSQAIIWTNAGILLIRTLGTNLSEILGELYSFSFSKMHLKMSSAKWRLFGLGLNELIDNPRETKLQVWVYLLDYGWLVTKYWWDGECGRGWSFDGGDTIDINKSIIAECVQWVDPLCELWQLWMTFSGLFHIFVAKLPSNPGYSQEPVEVNSSMVDIIIENGKTKSM